MWMKTADWLCKIVMAVSLFACGSVSAFELRVAGSVSVTGRIQADKERPFFEGLGKRTGLPLAINYQPIDLMDMDPEEGLELLQHNIVDLISLGVAVISKRDPFFLGLDIVGLAPDYGTARRVMAAFSKPVDQHLRDHYGAKLLGIWPFGPQVLFCKPNIDGLADIKGLKVRVYDANLGAFIEDLGAIAVPIKFAEVKQALELDIIDCAITGPSSANTAGWVQETTVTLPLGFQIAFNIYAMNLERWKALAPSQQQKISVAFHTFVDDVWTYSEELYEDALRCNVDKTPCSSVPAARLEEIAVEETDRELVRNALTITSLPTWKVDCDRQHPRCGQVWSNTVGSLLELN
jgi:TRAP-type C4-dicarboxylate transport system substrate-binding protein